MKDGLWVEEVDEEVARKVANIIGPNSAAGKALDQLKARRDAGEDVAIVKAAGGFIVVPRASISNIVQMPR